MKTISDLIMGLLVLSAIIVGGGLFAIEMFKGYNQGAIEQVSSLQTLSKTDQITTTYIQGVQNATLSGQQNFIQTAELVLSGGISALISIITLPGMIGQIAGDFFTAAGIPLPIWFFDLIIAGIGVFVLYRVLAIITKAEGGKV